MCEQVFQGKDSYATPGELSLLLGSTNALVWKDHEGEMDWCLCCIDVPATLGGAGLRWKQDCKRFLVVEE